MSPVEAQTTSRAAVDDTVTGLYLRPARTTAKFFGHPVDENRTFDRAGSRWLLKVTRGRGREPWSSVSRTSVASRISTSRFRTTSTSRRARCQARAADGWRWCGRGSVCADGNRCRPGHTGAAPGVDSGPSGNIEASIGGDAVLGIYICPARSFDPATSRAISQATAVAIEIHLPTAR